MICSWCFPIWSHDATVFLRCDPDMDRSMVTLAIVEICGQIGRGLRCQLRADREGKPLKTEDSFGSG